MLLGLDGLELVLVHDSLADVHTVHVASVADISETEVQVGAVEADPVADSFSFLSIG